MVKREGKKSGVVTGGTIKYTYLGRSMQRSEVNQGEVIEYEDGKVVGVKSLNKGKNWEIIENGPKNAPTLSKEERKEKNRKTKKDEFENNLKTRGHHKEPPKKQEKQKNEKEIKEKVDGVVIVHSQGETKGAKDLLNDGIVVVTPPSKKETLVHKRHKRDKGSFDYWDQTPFHNAIKNDTSIDFKAEGFLKKKV